MNDTLSISYLKNRIAPYIKNIGGWTTNRKIVVIESDDWGSIRMPSKEVYNKFLNAGYPVDEHAYERYDSLASEDDLELLFDLLTSFRDKNGNHPVITANALAANPDFEKIKNSEFKEYHYELITETFRRYPQHGRAFELWKEGMEKKVFFPQSHGREHLNVSMFMDALQRGDQDVHFGFSHGLAGSLQLNNGSYHNNYVEALKYKDESDKLHKLQIILEGLDLFTKLFGFRSKSFIPPNYIWSCDYNEPMSQRGIRYYQGNRKMKEPQLNGSFNYHTYKLGDKNQFGQRYLVRNCVFEPSLCNNKIDKPVNNCLKSISAAFALNKCAIICNHRLNYVGFIDENNRDKNLNLLQHLLSEIIKKWPDVEFLTSDQLGQIIEKDCIYSYI